MRICHICEGKGERNYGMVAEGVYPNVEEYYRGIDKCDICNGTGKVKEYQGANPLEAIEEVITKALAENPDLVEILEQRLIEKRQRLDDRKKSSEM